MPVHQMDEIYDWISHINKATHVSIRKNKLSDSSFWLYDLKNGEIRNKSNSFFKILGIQKIDSKMIVLEQPIIVQNEIGYLGIICHNFSGQMHFLMQAKIEPGNINKIQVSPTIQATKSNFTQKHGGKKPAYVDYFINAKKYKIIVDQIQSEQSSRFYKKRNRNIVIEVDEDIEVFPTHFWMTLPQLKELMRIDNLVNMDTRTVLSCIPFSQMSNAEFESYYPRGKWHDYALLRSIRNDVSKTCIIPCIYQYVNNRKMFDECEYRIVPLHSLKSWKMTDDELVCDKPYNFKVVFCDIEIEGREVSRWTQPLFEALGIATFGLVTCVHNGIREFLIQGKQEIGCFDYIELGPSIQREFIYESEENIVDRVFNYHLNNKSNILFDTLLSEEGGRFYCEQNRNVIIEIEFDELAQLPEGYFWLDYKSLNMLVQVNNNLNIQLRNLLAVLPW